MKRYALSIFLSLFLPQGIFAFNGEAIPDSIIEKAEIKYGEHTRKRFEAYNTLLGDLKGATEMQKLIQVNDFFNRIPYAYDKEVWAKEDYWATPLEFLGRDRGDCEDYVIAKYFALKTLGVDPAKLYFSYVRSTRLNTPHMVLTYFKAPNYVPLVLDSLNYRISPATKRTDLIPIYNFNGDNLFLARKAGHGKALEINEKTHKKWDDLLTNIKRNKL